jgi:hypothetical protein
MKHQPAKIAELIAKYKIGELTADEKKDLDDWLAIEENREYFKKITGSEGPWDWDHLTGINSGRIWEKINTGLPHQEAVIVKHNFKWKRLIAAASIVVAATALGWLLWKNTTVRNLNEPAITSVKKDLLPGSDRALLTLANGKVIDLSSAKNEQLAEQTGMIIEKKADGQLAYVTKTGNGQPRTNTEPQLTLFNTVSTPRGGQYKVILPDQTAVWLNASSSIRFPPVFTGNTRTVEVSGEAYFEVKKNATMPFIVKIKNMEVTVLGTHFDVMGYEDENEIKTTLLEGSVRVHSRQQQERNIVVLKPGQQSSMNKNGRLNIANEVNTDQAVAWAKGYFQFKNDDVATIMRQIARWYDVDIVYKSKIPAGKYTGKISRSTQASEVLKMLQLGGIKYEIEGNRLIIQ